MVYNLPVRNAAIRKLVKLYQEVCLFALVGDHRLILRAARPMRVQGAVGKNA